MCSAKAALLTFFLLVSTVFAQTAQSKDLILLNWSNYMDPEILLEFEQSTGITVKLWEVHCDQLQGFLLSRPLSAVDMIRFLQERQTTGSLKGRQ